MQKSRARDGRSRQATIQQGCPTGPRRSRGIIIVVAPNLAHLVARLVKMRNFSLCSKMSGSCIASSGEGTFEQRLDLRGMSVAVPCHSGGGQNVPRRLAFPGNDGRRQEEKRQKDQRVRHGRTLRGVALYRNPGLADVPAGRSLEDWQDGFTSRRSDRGRPILQVGPDQNPFSQRHSGDCPSVSLTGAAKRSRSGVWAMDAQIARQPRKKATGAAESTLGILLLDIELPTAQPSAAQ